MASEMEEIDIREQRYQQIREEAEAAAGPTSSLRMRARGYLDVYQYSNGTCHFALIAAHGALWASWYLIFARIIAFFLAFVDLTGPYRPLKRYRELAAYVTALKEINRLVMVESHVLVHGVKELGVDFITAKNIPEDLAYGYAQAMSKPERDDAVLRDLFHRHFLWEQERVVSTRLDDAFAALTWPLMKNLCERPWVWFSYFRAGKSLNFKRFTDQEERVEKGLIAYDRAVAFGLDRVTAITDIRLKILPGIPIVIYWLTGRLPR